MFGRIVGNSEHTSQASPAKTHRTLGSCNAPNGRACSNARLARRTSASAPIAPTICRPIGRPARVRPQGMEAEWPAQTGSPARHPYDPALMNNFSVNKQNRGGSGRLRGGGPPVVVAPPPIDA